MHAMIFNGAAPPYTLQMSKITVGQVLVCVGLPSGPLGSGPSNPAPTPFTAASAAATAVGSVGTSYNVTAITPDPNRSRTVAGVSVTIDADGIYPNDTVTLDGGIGAIDARVSWCSSTAPHETRGSRSCWPVFESAPHWTARPVRGVFRAPSWEDWSTTSLKAPSPRSVS